MKYLLVLGVVLFGIWLWRHNRVADAREGKADRTPTPTPAPGQQPSVPIQMVACAQCGLHLPLADAVTGPHGHYCTDAHRSAHEG